ncbi:MAG: uroporphyrinogen decarboxylase family protein [Tissierellia bacterium]|nr:uroporphyrinogen decarboxylase family protein [Tissierellia bacterium]MDD4781737.1 uroporphyrinogen decarboxylase family protein [Tissierellia bacterium]
MNCLTVQERMKRLNSGLPIDRVPLLTNATVFSGNFARLTAEKFFCNMESMFHSQLMTRSLFGCHGAPSFSHVNWVGESLGSENTYANSEFGILIPQIKPIIKSVKDAEEFSLPNSLNTQVLKWRYEFIEIARANGFSKVAMTAGSVIEMLTQIVDVSLLFRWMIREPELVFKLCDQMAEYLLQIIDSDIKQYGVDNCIALFFYPMEAKGIMSPRLVEKYSFPYIEYMHQQLTERGVSNYNEHLCGNHNENLLFFKNLNLPSRTNFSLDEKTDLLKTSTYLGSDYIISGNVSTKILVSGSIQDVINECQQIIEIGKKLKGGFILAPSCDLPPNAPPLNLYAMNEAICKYGTY